MTLNPADDAAQILIKHGIDPDIATVAAQSLMDAGLVSKPLPEPNRVVYGKVEWENRRGWELRRRRDSTLVGSGRDLTFFMEESTPKKIEEFVSILNAVAQFPRVGAMETRVTAEDLTPRQRRILRNIVQGKEFENDYGHTPILRDCFVTIAPEGVPALTDEEIKRLSHTEIELNDDLSFGWGYGDLPYDWYSGYESKRERVVRVLTRLGRDLAIKLGYLDADTKVPIIEELWDDYIP